MILSLLLLAAPGPTGVDVTLKPSALTVPVGCTLETKVLLTASSSSSVTAVDLVLSWDPSDLDLIETVTGSPGSWFLTGFLNDPDGINDDLDDGQALYTALASPASPVPVPPELHVVTFRFLVLDDAVVELLPTLGAFGETRVLGTSPGLPITGTISGPVSITAPVVFASEVVRLGTPANPAALLPGVTTPPVRGLFWDPVIDHTTFMPDSILDAIAVTIFSINAPTGLGTLLCDITGYTRLYSAPAPGVPFSIKIPKDCSLVGETLCAQGGSVDPLGLIELTNALDFTIGNF